MNDTLYRRQTIGAALVIFGVILLIVAGDLITDYQYGVAVTHVFAEGAIIALVVVGIGLLTRRYMELRSEARRLEEKLEVTRDDAERWRREAKELLEGLGEAIDRQFDRWELTPAEREVALFLLKGFSHKEIAEYRDVSDRTIRQQAHAVYEKADVSGRAQLSAFFLEDLLLPSLDTSDERPDDQDAEPKDSS
jgi:DNA-binding CsgD family transcriptional regulator